MTEDWTVTMGMPQGAVRLPPPEADTGKLITWAEDAARKHLPPSASEVQVAAFTNVLLEAAADARQRSPIIAFAFCPDPAAGELARVEVRPLDTGEAATAKTVQDLANVYATRTPLSVHDPDVMLVELPAGPSVRVVHEYAAESGPILTFVHALLPPQLDVGIAIFMSWQTLYYSDRLFELGDALAASLRVEGRCAG